MDSEIDIETVTGDVEAVERHARANIEALCDELTRNLRTRLAGIGWQGGIRVRADPHGGEYEPGYRAYVISTDAWHDQLHRALRRPHPTDLEVQHNPSQLRCCIDPLNPSPPSGGGGLPDSSAVLRPSDRG